MITYVGATASEDFFHSSAIATLSSSSPRACLNVPIIYDASFEGTEFFSVTLHVKAARGHVILQPQSAVVSIKHVNGEYKCVCEKELVLTNH